MPYFLNDGKQYQLDSPTLTPNAASFLWNKKMMLQVTCRGFAVGQFMQPEPTKYAHAPVLAAKTFMQPEHPYFSHHPGRFFYVKDNESGELFSAPFEPVKAELDSFEFTPGMADIRWRIVKNGIEVNLTLSLTPDDVVEIWQVSVKNNSNRPRQISIVPYFPVGYSSWMNMSANYDSNLNGMVCQCISPYQKVAEYLNNQDDKDLTYLLADRKPTSWEASQKAFEGDSGLHNPQALQQRQLNNGDCLYEIPACILQYDFDLTPQQSETTNFLFGPARDVNEIEKIRNTYLSESKIHNSKTQYQNYVNQAFGTITIDSPDADFNHFVNHWLPRQVFYHGDSNRLSTDPQTRNYLQDAMGMAYIKPSHTRTALLTALAQQKSNGEMPDGILLTEEAELKYINQIPHTDHCVWLVICLQAYLNETGDLNLLNEQVTFSDSTDTASVYKHLCLSMDWLIKNRDARGLSFIAQGDWCDPMNMVGYKGKGVSGWLTQALSFALQHWASICRTADQEHDAEHYLNISQEINSCINKHLWDGNWYARGITDDGIHFGTQNDNEGRIFLNTQSWAFFCNAPNAKQQQKMLHAIAEQLDTPFGPAMFAPAFTAMRDDIGRVTQKFPGSAENGSVYNHAAAFYASSLFHINKSDLAFDVLRKMIPGPSKLDFEKRGQLPVYIPNYYRGAYYQFPRTAGRSSHLFNTGTVSWYLQMVVESLAGLKGQADGLLINPQLPSSWNTFNAVRQFRGATIKLNVTRSFDCSITLIKLDGQVLEDNTINKIEAGNTYNIDVVLKK